MITIRPFEEPDLDYLCESRLTSVTELEDPAVGFSTDSFKKSLAGSHVRYYIKLDKSVPCINSVLCGSRYGAAANVLGLKGVQLEGLAKFDYCLNTDTGAIIPYDNHVTGNVLFNGAAVLWLIDNLQISERIKSSISNIAFGAEIEPWVALEPKQNVKDFLVFGNWGFDVPNTAENRAYLQRARAQAKSMWNKGELNRTSTLINLMNGCGSDEDVRKYLRGILVYQYVPVIPVNMRPKMEAKKHPITEAYVKLFNTNNDASIYTTGNLTDFVEFYKTIFCYVDSITCFNHYVGQDNIVSRDDDLKSLRPLLTTIKGKTGSIRSGMLKKRQDYSGRSAVVVDPFLPLNSISVPKSMASKMYRRYALSDCKISAEDMMARLSDPEFEEHMIKELVKENVIPNVPILLGRNPTLHRYGIQGFKPRLNDGRAIQVSPLVCPAFNMDFDGDSAHSEVPLDPLAIREINTLVMTDKNILLCKTGESTICPRMDIVYGLYVCTRSTYRKEAPTASFSSYDELKAALYEQRVLVWDTVTAGQKTDLAGRIAFESCFPAGVINKFPQEEINSKNIKKYVAAIQDFDSESFDGIINRLVELGMKISFIYSKSVSLLKDLKPMEDFDTAFDQFHESMKEIDELNDFGFYDYETYGVEYSNKLRDTTKILEKDVVEKIGDNMFVDMAQSGARGNKANLVQMFGSKGRIQRSDSEMFNVVIENGLHKQLTPMEHSIAAHGARKGQIAKSIKTADTGYLGRKLAHVSSPIIITCKDCGTSNGWTVDWSEILSYIVKSGMSEKDIADAEQEAERVMVRFISGRYLASNGLKISEAEAQAYAKKHGAVKIRTPMTCENPCCQKCYGNDTSTNRTVAVGMGVGFIAAQSLSEPSTQLTMKEFQSGGVTGAASPFDRLNAILSQSDIRELARRSTYYNYDPVAWAPGKLIKEPFSSRRVVLRIEKPKDYDDDSKEYSWSIQRIVPDSAEYREGEIVKPGETLRKDRGDCYLPEVIKYVGLEAAQKTAVYTLYFLFKSQVDLLPIHIELTVASMTVHKPLITDVPELRLGRSYTKKQLVELDENYHNTVFDSSIAGVISVVKNSPNFLEAFIMEDQRAALSDAALNCLYEMGDSPLVQMALGRKVKVGTGYSDTFLEDR